MRRRSAASSNRASRWRSSHGPSRRAEVLLGRWLGSALIVVAYTIASGLLAIAVATQISGYGPPDPVLAVAFLSGQALVLLTLTLALGSVLPSIAAGAIAVVGLRARLDGRRAGRGGRRVRGRASLGQVAEISRWILPSDGLWRGVIYGLEPPLVVLLATGNLPRFADANPFYAAAPPPLPFVIWSIVWIALVLGVSRAGGSSAATSESGAARLTLDPSATGQPR